MPPRYRFAAAQHHHRHSHAGHVGNMEQLRSADARYVQLVAGCWGRGRRGFRCRGPEQFGIELIRVGGRQLGLNRLDERRPLLRVRQVEDIEVDRMTTNTGRHPHFAAVALAVEN